MTRRILMTTVLVTLTVGVTTAAGRAGDEVRGRSGGEATMSSDRLAPVDTMAPLGRRGKCDTVKCVRRLVRALTGAHNELVAAHNSVADFLNNCLRIQGVSQYGDPSGTTFGYMWDEEDDGTWNFNISALDYDSSATPDLLVVHAIC